MQTAAGNTSPAHRERLAWLDTAKGIALLLVLFGHCFRDSMRQQSPLCAFLYDFVYAFHVPVFFFVAGMCYALGRKRYRAQSCGRGILAKLRAYMLPWFSYSVLVYLLFFTAQHLPPLARMLPDGMPAVTPPEYLRLMLCNENPYAFHLWYLYTQFLFLALVRLIDRFRSEKRFRGLLVLLILLSSIAYQAFAKHWIWTVKGFLQQLTFFLLGVLISPELLLRRRRQLLLAGAAGALLIALRLTAPVSAALSDLGPAWDAVDFVLCRAGVIAMILAVVATSSLLEPTRAGGALTQLGRNSLAWYLYHQPFCCALLGGLLYDALGLPMLPCIAACFAASLAFPPLLRMLIRALHLDGICRRIGLPC